jgi:hypothetical protein
MSRKRKRRKIYKRGGRERERERERVQNAYSPRFGFRKICNKFVDNNSAKVGLFVALTLHSLARSKIVRYNVAAAFYN